MQQKKKSHLTSFLLLLAVSAISSNRPEFIYYYFPPYVFYNFSQFINKLLQFLLDFKNLPKRHISYIHADLVLISGDFSKNTCHSATFFYAIPKIYLNEAARAIFRDVI